MVRVAIVGACGRMGLRLGTLCGEDDELRVAAALECKGHADLERDYGEVLGCRKLGVEVSEILPGPADVIIDFSTPESTAHWVEVARDHKIAMVIGTTGLGDPDHARIDAAAKNVPIVQAPNMSVGVNLLFRLAGQIAQSLGEEYDIEIVEAHHRFKKDAPSGTALELLRSVCRARNCDPKQVAVFGREGVDSAREKGQIGVHALRLGDTVGEHAVHFGTLGETVSILHSVHNRDTFAAGALRAAKWVVGKPAKRYSMQDVLFGG